MKTAWLPITPAKPLTRCQILGVCQSKMAPGCTHGCRKVGPA